MPSNPDQVFKKFNWNQAVDDAEMRHIHRDFCLDHIDHKQALSDLQTITLIDLVEWCNQLPYQIIEKLTSHEQSKQDYRDLQTFMQNEYTKLIKKVPKNILNNHIGHQSRYQNKPTIKPNPNQIIYIQQKPIVFPNYNRKINKTLPEVLPESLIRKFTSQDPYLTIEFSDKSLPSLINATKIKIAIKTYQISAYRNNMIVKQWLYFLLDIIKFNTTLRRRITTWYANHLIDPKHENAIRYLYFDNQISFNEAHKFKVNPIVHADLTLRW